MRKKKKLMQFYCGFFSISIFLLSFFFLFSFFLFFSFWTGMTFVYHVLSSFFKQRRLGVGRMKLLITGKITRLSFYHHSRPWQMSGAGDVSMHWSLPTLPWIRDVFPWATPSHFRLSERVLKGVKWNLNIVLKVVVVAVLVLVVVVVVVVVVLTKELIIPLQAWKMPAWMRVSV